MTSPLIDSSALTKAKEKLLDGDVVAIPTETVYGLAASINSEKGLRKIFSLKERPFFDPLIVHVASFKEAASLVKEWPPLADYLARVFWPGPLTLVLPKADHVNPLITSGLETVAIRYPSHSLAQDLIRLVGTPLAAPSANKFGHTSPSTADHVRSEFPGTSLLILEGGDCDVGVESTVISFVQSPSGQTDIEILRPGGVTEESLRAAIGKWSNPVEIRRASSEASPGHLKHHYMPAIPLIILEDEDGLSTARRKDLTTRLKLKSLLNPVELRLDENPQQAARELYSSMRAISESGADLIYVIKSNKTPTDGLWSAIWDRLTRAASLTLPA